ncbi:hypothetical protein FOL47_005382 [Perkinsus chesapeaki]|uniref:Uncharacterized protein n=1 Tax=Perkinsus chesapeaki TaxID=330153 RepID=A0A7J6N2K4_PERCH|nr:hypothetical protein FOL47_005382 [Perkinsus chesapeaki]
MMRQTFIYIVTMMICLPSVAHEDRELFDFSQIEGNFDLYLSETSTSTASPVETGTTWRPGLFEGITLDPVFGTAVGPTTQVEVEDRLQTSQATIPSPEDHGPLLVVIIILLVILVASSWVQFYLGLRMRRNHEGTEPAFDATVGKLSAGTSETSNDKV